MKMMKKIKKSKTCKAQKITKGEYMVKVKNMMEKGLSAVRDLSDFFKEVARNRKQKKALRTDEDENLLPEMKTFNGIPLRDYCWLRDEIFRTELKRRRKEGGEGFACRAIIIFSIAFLISGLAWIHFGIFTAMLSFVAMAGRILEMDLEKEVQSDKFLMSFPEYGIWNSDEVKDFKYNFEYILGFFGYSSGRIQGTEFKKIFTMTGIDYEKPVYKIELEKTSLLLNIFYGLNDWKSSHEMLYDIRKGEFTAAELFKRRNELCSLENNFVKKGKKKYRKTRKDSEFERKEIDGKIYNKYVDHP